MDRAKYKQLMIAATQIRDEIMDGHHHHTFVPFVAFHRGRPQCVGGHILCRSGYRPPDHATGVSRGVMDEYLGEPTPRWLLSVWHDLEEANDDVVDTETVRMRYIVTKLNELIRRIEFNIRPVEG